MSNSIGLYIHIPFCKHKCPYCDFFSGNADENAFDNYVIELKDKIKYWSEKAKRDVATVYFGGGTPSVLGADRLCDILDFIKFNFNIKNNAEITVEVNPDSAKTIDFEKMYACGFNRISMGMQTAVEDELRLLGRIHSIDDAKTSVGRAKSAGFNNISLDLMMGIPNQTIESLEKINQFLCRLQSYSYFIIHFENRENTPFYKVQNNLSLPMMICRLKMYLKSC